MLESLTGVLSNWMVNPWLLLGGAVLISSPIIIHLLNKRKFRTVDWAAMDFLIEADKRNRRRIRLENLLLLLLRCLAVLLIGLLLARPFRPLGALGRMFESVRYERIVVLDDSLSMQARAGGRSPLEEAKRGLSEFVVGLTGNDSDDSLTLVLTSKPNQPVFNDVPLNDETAAEIAREIKELVASDRTAGFDQALLEVEKSLGTRSANVNRVVYVVSDMRQRDWDTAAKTNDRAGIVETLRRFSDQVAGCFLIDVGGDEVGNLVVSDIMPRENALVAGVGSRFEVRVRNTGTRDVSQVQVKLTAGESIPLTGAIDSIPAGGSASIPFTYTFARPEDELFAPGPEPVPIRVEIAAVSNVGDDRLAADNVRYYAARVVRGVPALIVDGDPSATYGRSESFFLARALNPPGDVLSGIAAKTVTDVEFETEPLDNYQVIYLCNMYQLSEQRRSGLEAWVKAGGGLVILLGDQIDEQLYNEDLYRRGQGLLPLKVETIRGDETEQKWVFFSIEQPNHPVLRVFQGESNPFLEGAKIFRWWQSSVPEDDLKAGRVSVAARLTDTESSPAIVEKPFGDGRVLVFTTPADSDWSNWPEDVSFLIAMQELNRYMSRKSADEGTMSVGEPIRLPLNLTQYKLDVSVTGPAGENTPVQPIPNPNQAPKGDESTWVASYEETNRRGFYKLALTRTDGETENVLFAANIEAGEGELQRVDGESLRRELGDASVELVKGAQLLSLSAEGPKGELWLYVLGALVVILCVEQFLGWWFGLRR